MNLTTLLFSPNLSLEHKSSQILISKYPLKKLLLILLEEPGIIALLLIQDVELDLILYK
jgi:hypothetical protein